MPRLFALLAAFTPLLVIGACVTPQSAVPPQIALENVRLLEARGLMQMVRVDLMVTNPNDFDIPLTGLDFSMTVNGVDFAEGLSNAVVTIPRRGRATVPVEVAISMLAVLRQVQAVQKSGTLDYRLSGTAFLDHVLLQRLDFERAGSLGLRNDSGGRRLQALEG
jgi:LEA14-like dessication related protein